MVVQSFLFNLNLSKEGIPIKGTIVTESGKDGFTAINCQENCAPGNNGMCVARVVEQVRIGGVLRLPLADRRIRCGRVQTPPSNTE